MTPSDRPVLQSDVEVHPVEDGCVVWVPATDQVHFLNHTAMRILELCDGRLDAATLQTEFGDAAEVGFDVCSGILDQFERAAIVAPAAGTKASGQS